MNKAFVLEPGNQRKISGESAANLSEKGDPENAFANHSGVWISIKMMIRRAFTYARLGGLFSRS